MHRTRRHRSGTHAPRPRPTSLSCLARGTRKFRIIIMHSRNYLQFLNHLEISSAPKDDALSRPLPPNPPLFHPSSNAPFLLLCTATPTPTPAWSGLLLIGNVLSEHHAPQAHPTPSLPLHSLFGAHPSPLASSPLLPADWLAAWLITG